MSPLKRTERGWAAHFCGAPDCRYRRNTLLEYGRKRIVVSTIGVYVPADADAPIEIGHDRFYETMAFKARKNGKYWEANVNSEVFFESNWRIGKITRTSDNDADAMHEAVVAEISGKLKKGQV